MYNVFNEMGKTDLIYAFCDVNADKIKEINGLKVISCSNKTGNYPYVIAMADIIEKKMELEKLVSTQLFQDMKALYTSGNTVEKIMVLTVISSIKLYLKNDINL